MMNEKKEEEGSLCSEVSRSITVNFATAVNVGQRKETEKWQRHFRLQNILFLQIDKSLSAGAN